jgi:hypothetical protein
MSLFSYLIKNSNNQNTKIKSINEHPNKNKKQNQKQNKKLLTCQKKKKKQEITHLRNDDVPNTTILVITIKPMRMPMPMLMSMRVITHVPITCILTMRVRMSMVRRVCMHPNNVHSTTFFFSKHFSIPLFITALQNRLHPGLQTLFLRPDPYPILICPLLFSLVILGPHEVHEEGHERGHHSKEPTEWELGPWVLGQARVG